MTRLILILALMALAACETTRGFGRDLEAAGESIQRSIR
jgi:predicted small secreted protein